MKQNKSFKPYKCLLYKDNFDGIIEGKLRPPIELSLDPCNACNLKCKWCNAWRVRDDNKIMSKEDLFWIIKEAADWGVKGVCIAGGGEPTMHPQIAEAIELCTKEGLESAIISNGLNWSDKLIKAMVKNMRWVGISVDAANANTFLKEKGVDGFDRVIKNIKNLVKEREVLKNKTGPGITLKFVIHPLNQEEIYDACKLAKEIGVDAIHLRPVDFLSYQETEDDLDVRKINEEVRKAVTLNDNNFEVVPFFANCQKDMKRKITFDNCLLSPLIALCMPTGWWSCVDRRGDEGTKLCDIRDIRKFWGSKEHLEILKKINPSKDCGKCTMAKYYPWYEAYKNDEFFWKFA